MLTLPRIPFLKSPVKAVEDQSLVPAPQGREQKLFGTVPCNPVNGHVRGKQFHAVNHKVKVFLHGILPSLVMEGAMKPMMINGTQNTIT